MPKICLKQYSLSFITPELLKMAVLKNCFPIYAPFGFPQQFSLYCLLIMQPLKFKNALLLFLIILTTRMHSTIAPVGIQICVTKNIIVSSSLKISNIRFRVKWIAKQIKASLLLHLNVKTVFLSSAPTIFIISF